MNKEKVKVQISIDYSDYFEGTIDGYIEHALFEDRDNEIYRLKNMIAKKNSEIRDLKDKYEPREITKDTK